MLTNLWRVVRRRAIRTTLSFPRQPRALIRNPHPAPALITARTRSRLAGKSPYASRRGRISAEHSLSTWAAALAVALFCVGAALIIAGLVQAPEPSAALPPLPRTAHLPLQPNEIPNRDKKAAREAVISRRGSRRISPRPSLRS